MPTARVNGIDIHYRESGEGYAVFLVHGFTGNLRNWALQIPTLTDEFRTVSIDHRGHGHSAKPRRREDYSLEIMAADAAALLAHLDIEDCYLVGHSMGGMVAQHLALSHPELIRALALVDTTAEVPSQARASEHTRLGKVVREQGMEAAFEELLGTSPMAEQLRAQPQLVEVWRREFLLTSREGYLYAARAMAERTPLLDKLDSIDVPTLIVCGANDEPYLEPSRRMHERIRGSELVIIAGAGHTPQIEKSAEFNRVLTEFLSRVHRGVAAGG